MFQCISTMTDCSVCNKSTLAPNCLKLTCGCCFHSECLNIIKSCPNCNYEYSSFQIDEIKDKNSASHFAILTKFSRNETQGPYCHVLETLQMRKREFSKRFKLPIIRKQHFVEFDFIKCLVNRIGKEMFEIYQNLNWTWEMVLAFVVCMFEVCSKYPFVNSNIMTETISNYFKEKLYLENWSSFVPEFTSFNQHEYLIVQEMSDWVKGYLLYTDFNECEPLKHKISWYGIQNSPNSSDFSD